MRDYDDVERAVAPTVAPFGGLDILVNNAGVGIFVNVADMTPAQWADVIDTNLTGVFNACHAAIPHLRAARRRLHHQHQQPGGEECLRRRARRTARRRPG